jgi:hypothetical protein
MPLPSGANRVRIRATVPFVAERKTAVIAGLFLGNASVATVQRKAEAAAGQRTVIELDQTFEAGGTGAVGVQLRVGIGDDSKVFLNGTDTGENRNVGNPTLVIEVF